MRKWHESIPRFVTSTLLLFSTPASIPEIFQINITVSLRSKDYGSRQHLVPGFTRNSHYLRSASKCNVLNTAAPKPELLKPKMGNTYVKSRMAGYRLASSRLIHQDV